MIWKSKIPMEKVNVPPSALSGVYATLSRGFKGEDFNLMFSKSVLFVEYTETRLKRARAKSKRSVPSFLAAVSLRADNDSPGTEFSR